MAILELVCKWEAQRQSPNVQPAVKLGDGYSLNSPVRNSDRETWSISAPTMNLTQMLTTIATLNAYAGATVFQWREHPNAPYRDFTCKQWNISPNSSDSWELSATFEQFRGS